MISLLPDATPTGDMAGKELYNHILLMNQVDKFDKRVGDSIAADTRRSSEGFLVRIILLHFC